MTRRLHDVTFYVIIISSLLLWSAPAWAEIPHKINYQARLADTATGEPLVGTYSTEFRLYDAPVAGTLLWDETQTVDSDSAGIFSVILGSDTEIALTFDEPVWLEVVVEGEVLSPRREIVSVPFAFRTGVAEHADGADSLGGHSSDEFIRAGEISVITSEMIIDGTGSGLDADMVDGLHADAFADTSHVHLGYVAKGEISSVSGEMIIDGGITDDDIAPEAGIDPAKLSGGAWTSANDGTGSGLDADMVDGFHADAFAEAGHDHNELYLTREYLETPGTVNDPENPVDWSKLKGVPAGFADSVDDVGSGVGDGYSLDAADGDPVDQVFVDSDGKVGIGTVSPAMRFDVAGGMSRLQNGLIVGSANYGVSGIHIYDDDTGPRLRLTDASGLGDASISLMDGVGSNWSWSLRAGQYFALVDNKANEWRLFISPSGDIGIGTTTPQRRLHVVGENPRILIEASSMNPEVNLKSHGDPNSKVWAIYKDSGSGDLRFFQWGDKVTIEDSTGNVGVGTTAPTARLQANASSTAGLLGRSENEDGTVGWTGASDKSGVYGHSTNGSGVTGRSDNAFGVQAVGGGDASGYDNVGDLLLGGTYGEIFSFGTLLNIYTNGTCTLFLDHDNNGTDRFSIWRGEGGEVFSVEEDGNIWVSGRAGIGTTNPGYKLQVGEQGDGTEARANAWNTFSSREYKKDIRPFEPVDYRRMLEKLNQTKIVRYRFSQDPQQTEHIGVIAEDAPAEIRTQDGKAVTLADYSAFLLAAIKAQQEQIQELKVQVRDLQAQLDSR